MTNNKGQQCSFEELCTVTELSSQLIIEVVEHGIIEPEGTDPENWAFNTSMITVTKKAVRLHRDLGIDWQGIALAIGLLQELEDVKTENERLHRLLSRFTAESG